MAGSYNEHAEVLVTVKTYPTPSQHHVETVCVAGVRLDQTHPSWMRLYPLPFRAMGEAEKFKKWQMVEADVKARGSSDPRPESYSPEVNTIRLGEVIKSNGNWKRRKSLIEPLIGATTTCELIKANRAVRMSDPAPSLGLIRPIISKVELVQGKLWTPSQLAKAKRAAEPDLFNAPLAELQPPPWMIRYKYRCASRDCNGHLQTNLDWEVGVAGIMWHRRYGDSTGKMILQQWTNIVSDEKDVHFFVGNQHQRRESFSVLGVWYPKST